MPRQRVGYEDEIRVEREAYADNTDYYYSNALIENGSGPHQANISEHSLVPREGVCISHVDAQRSQAGTFLMSFLDSLTPCDLQLEYSEPGEYSISSRAVVHMCSNYSVMRRGTAMGCHEVATVLCLYIYAYWWRESLLALRESGYLVQR